MRYTIPPPSVLAERVQNVISTAEKFVCADNKTLLFKQHGPNAMATVHANQMIHINNGCCSDPPGVTLHYIVKETNGLPTYHCVRSSSQLEGFHYHLRRLLSSFYISPLLMDAITLSFVHKWNLDTGVRNLNQTKLFTTLTELVDEAQALTFAVYGKVLFLSHIITPDIPDAAIEHALHYANDDTYADVRLSPPSTDPSTGRPFPLADDEPADASVPLGDESSPESEPDFSDDEQPPPRSAPPSCAHNKA